MSATSLAVFSADWAVATAVLASLASFSAMDTWPWATAIASRLASSAAVCAFCKLASAVAKFALTWLIVSSWSATTNSWCDTDWLAAFACSLAVSTCDWVGIVYVAVYNTDAVVKTWSFVVTSSALATEAETASAAIPAVAKTFLFIRRTTFFIKNHYYTIIF